jgi:uncharacterized membrane protein YdjX (TVP38/TMEM64 family)
MNKKPQSAAASNATPGMCTPEQRLFSVRKLAFFVLVVAAALIIVQFTPLKEQLKNVQALKTWMASAGAWAPILSTLAATVLVAIGVPRLMLCGIAGLLFGFVQGFAVMQIATLASAYITFLFVRWTGVHWAARQVARHPFAKALLEEHTAVSVFLVRQLPIHGLALNVLLSATSVSHRDFLVGSFFGFLPMALVATLVGSGIGKASPVLAWLQIGTALVCAAISARCVLMLYRKVKAHQGS